jgi:hypothetical protein
VLHKAARASRTKELFVRDALPPPSPVSLTRSASRRVALASQSTSAARARGTESGDADERDPNLAVNSSGITNAIAWRSAQITN